MLRPKLLLLMMIATISFILLLSSSSFTSPPSIAILPGPLRVLASSNESAAAFTSYKVIQHLLPHTSSHPAAITSDSSGRIWFVEQQSNQVGSYDPSTDSFGEYVIPTANALPEGIAVDSYGNVWFTELTPSNLGELRHGTASIKEVSIPTAIGGIPCGPIGVTPGKGGGGGVWMTCEFSNQIDEYFPVNGTFHQYNLPVIYSAPLQILFDKSGNFWFTAADADMLGYVTTRQLRDGTSNGIQEFAPVNETYPITLGNPQQSSSGQQMTSSLWTPSQVAMSPDGNSLWITEHGAGSFDRYDLVTKSLVKYFTSTPSDKRFPESLPNGIAVDSQGVVWIAEHYGNRIARFDPITEQLTEFQIPCCSGSIAGTLYLALGNNGTVWFTELGGNAIGEVRATQSDRDLSIILSPERATAPSTGNLTIGISFSLGSSKSASPMSVALSLAGISRTGKLKNVTSSFEPGNLSFSSNATAASSKLVLKAMGLRPGTYYLTVGGKSSVDNVTHAAILKLTVQNTRGSFLDSLLSVAALTIGVAASVAIIVLIAVITVRRRR